MAIVISHLAKRIEGQTILEDINLTIHPGEIVGLLGPNGAGKTTLLRIITHALDYNEGSVRVCDVDVAEYPLLTTKKIGYLPEHNPLYEDMYILEYLMFIAEIHRVSDAKKRVDELIDLVGLRQNYKKQISTLSKGYKQRVGLAQALVFNPDVLILDEPTTGLDPNQLVEIRELIKEIGKNRTVILSTHVLQEVKELCTRAVIMNEGRIVADVKDVKTMKTIQSDNQVFVVEFQNPVKTENLRALPNVIDVTDGPHLFHIESKEDVRLDVFKFAVNENNPILTMHKLTKTLEEIFRDYTVKNA